MRDGPSEELLEYELEHKQHQQRLEDTSADSQQRSLVLLLDIALDQFLEKELAHLAEGDYRAGTFVHVISNIRPPRRPGRITDCDRFWAGFSAEIWYAA